MKLKLPAYIVLLNLLLSCSEQKSAHIDLSGQWLFAMDTLDVGITERWYEKKLAGAIKLPGSMAENSLGYEITLQTQWTGEILDSSWYFDEKYARYRTQENLKIPFWLQPVKRYTGAAWYQKEIDIPAHWEGKYIELMLERPHWETKVWINDHYLGMQNSLGTPHIYALPAGVGPGRHTISIQVDNRIKETDPGASAHSITDNTQSNWNGIVGDMALLATAPVIIDKVQLYPDVTGKKVGVVAQIKNITGETQKGQLVIAASTKENPDNLLPKQVKEITLNQEREIKVDYLMGDSVLLWDEFNPNLYTLHLSLTTQAGTVKREETFGMREFKVEGKRFIINGRPIFLRGTLECAIFPKTGYPPTDKEAWKRIFTICKSHGLNHMRFHSWCPPKAAFDAADEMGFYLQVEASSWANSRTSTLGDGKPIDQWLYKEANDILEAYGNHPSFCMMAYGNEPGGKRQKEYLQEFVGHFKKQDNRRVYTGGAGWPYIDNMDYYNHAQARIQGWGQGLKSVINSQPPQTVFDYSHVVQNTPVPFVSHEIGQWCAYPNYKEIPKYTGVLQPKNFEIFKETLEENHMGHLADSFLLASGKLQALCYKADIEAALRTRDLSGFQLLDLHDFPGQGTALIGILDAFWEEKGYISPEEYRRFCNEKVPLVRLKKRVYLDRDTLHATVEVAHFGAKELKSISSSWRLVKTDGREIARGNFPATDIALGNGIQLGEIVQSLSVIKEAQKLILTVEVAGHTNAWDIWVYPAEKEKIEKQYTYRVVNVLDNEILHYLQDGGTVLLAASKGSVKPGKGGNVGIGFFQHFLEHGLHQ